MFVALAMLTKSIGTFVLFAVPLAANAVMSVQTTVINELDVIALTRLSGMARTKAIKWIASALDAGHAALDTSYRIWLPRLRRIITTTLDASALALGTSTSSELCRPRALAVVTQAMALSKISHFHVDRLAARPAASRSDPLADSRAFE